MKEDAESVEAAELEGGVGCGDADEVDDDMLVRRGIAAAESFQKLQNWLDGAGCYGH